MAFSKNIKSIVAFMAFPGQRLGKSAILGEASEKYMLESLETIVKSQFFTGIEVTRVKDPKLRKKLAEQYHKNNLYLTYSAQPMQLINEDHLMATSDIASISEIDRELAVARLKKCIDEAFEIRASQFCFLSGQDPENENDRSIAFRSLVMSVKEICRYNRETAKKSEQKPMKITLEIFDRVKDKRTKNQLIGPSTEARLLAELIKIDAGFPEFGLLFDISHMSLIPIGKSHETVDVIRMLKPFLNWVHVANSINDAKHSQYGDLHVSMDHPDGNVTPNLLKEFYCMLMDIDFQGGFGLEVMPFGDQLSESVVFSGIVAMKQAETQIQVNYMLGTYRFKTRVFLPERLFYKLTQFKIESGEKILEQAKKRIERPQPWTSNLLIIAADHPARYVTNVGEDEIAMGDRQQYFGRIVRILMDPHVDGIMTTPDIFDDLFALDYMLKQAGAESLLDNRILIGCTNRSGLAGSTYEMDDKTTAYTVQEAVDLHLDGIKMMFRLDLNTTQARFSQNTVVECAEMVRECGKYNIPAFIEPLPVEKVGDEYKPLLNHVDLIKTIGVATALGGTASHKIWLKIPFVDNFEQVARATSNPILLLGGAATGNVTETIINFEKGLGAGPNVKGALVGRNVLFPGFDDPRAVTLAIADLIHNYLKAEDCIEIIRNNRGQHVNYLTKALLTEERE